VVPIPATIEGNSLDAVLFRRFRDLSADLARHGRLSTDALVRLNITELLRGSRGQSAPLGIVYDLRVYVFRALENAQARPLGAAAYLLSHPAMTPVSLSPFTFARIHDTSPDNAYRPAVR
jgi:hypothetical protein